VPYWAGILCAVGFFILLVFMEETNFKKETGSDTTTTATLTQDVSLATTSIESQIDFGEKTPGRWTLSNLMRLARKMKRTRFLYDAIRPMLMLRFPILCFEGSLYESDLIWFNALNAMTSLVFGGHPYEFPPWSIGLTYLSPMAGAILASV
jgi:hypothetical protein